MQFIYKAKGKEGKEENGVIDVPNLELAVSALQKKGLIIISVSPYGKTSFFKRDFNIFERIKTKDVVIISRQLSTLFEAKVPVIDSLKIILEESESSILKRHISGIIEDIEGGLPMSQAFANHPEVFSPFFTSMIKVGEESGRLDEIFSFLADYLERNYELTSKVTNALIYPAFVAVAFIAVMIVMFVVVVPKLTSIIEESGQAIPIFTRIIMGISLFLREFGLFLLVVLVGGVVFVWRYLKTASGKSNISRVQISIPVINKIFKEFYLARISDNLDTLLSGGVAVIKSLELSSEVVQNEIYKNILKESIESIKGGGSISSAFSRYREIPPFVTQMIRIGEETGKLNFVLKTIARFYRKEVDNTVDALVKLIEPLMILFLGGGVGIIVAAILIPIYNIASSV